MGAFPVGVFEPCRASLVSGGGDWARKVVRGGVSVARREGVNERDMWRCGGRFLWLVRVWRGRIVMVGFA